MKLDLQQPSAQDRAEFLNDHSITAILIGTYIKGSDILWGLIYGDRKLRFDDGYYIHTSPILSYNKETRILITAKSKYLLIAPEPQELEVNQVQAFRDTLDFARKVGMEDIDASKAIPSLTYTHLLEMLARIEHGNMSKAKLGRYLGWAQAAVVASCAGATLDDMKAINARNSK